jgi:tetratricopeptide (TPR) repeat protein
MNQPADLTIQQWIETIRHAKDHEEIAMLAAVFDRVFHAAPLDDSARVDALLAAGEILSEKGQCKEAQRLLEMGTELAHRLQMDGKQALALGLLAYLERVQGNYRNALSKLTAARRILGEYPDHNKDISARLHIISGLNNMSLGEYQNSRDAFYEAYQVYSQMGDLKGRALAANRLGTIATMQSDYAEAEKYLQESLKLAKQLDDYHGMAGALLNLGEIHRHLGQFAQARACYVEAGSLFLELGLHRGMCIAENNLGHIAVKLQDYSASKHHYLTALECAKIASLTPDKLDTLAGIVFILVQREQYSDAARLIQFILHHPAHLQETEEFLEPAQKIVAEKQKQLISEIPPPDQLDQIIAEALKKVF